MKNVPTTAPKHRSRVTKPPVSDALAIAFEHHRRGRLDEAEAGYLHVLEATPDEPDALHRLGIIAHQRGRNDAALRLVDRARAINPANPTYQHDAGIILHALGRIDEAIARYRTALMLEPDYPKALNSLGIALNDRQFADEAAANFRAAVSLRPDYIEAWNNLGNILRKLGTSTEAMGAYRKALALRSGSPHLWHNIGGALLELGAPTDAIEACRRAIALEPDFADAQTTLGDALFALGHGDEAVACYARALRIHETPESIARFVRSFVGAELRSVDDHVKAMAIRALSVPWARPSDLAAAAIRLLARDAMQSCIDRAWDAWPARLRREDLFGASERSIVDDPLLRALLESAPVCDLVLERMLTLARSAMLDGVTRDAADVGMLRFCCALARQCFINDYVFSHTDDEIARATALRAQVAASLLGGDVPSPLAVAVVATYFPLRSLSQHDALLSLAWPEPVAALVAQQVREPMDERRLRTEIRQITSMPDGVSATVRAQYEEHPYPRWVKLPGADFRAATGPRNLSLLPTPDRTGDIDILVAGCGTGQESIEFAHAFPRARVLAIDLSLASLAYAERKAREMGVTNVEHAQADLLAVPVLGRQFDVISCVGVLHHLAEPMRGMEALVRMLKSRGQMLVGLYSERARADVVAARGFIAEHGYEATDADIRRCRQALMAVDDGRRFAMLAMRQDFYVTSECRDLLFHEQEHRFTLSQIRACLDVLALDFCGFALPREIASRYRKDYPADTAFADFDNFVAFEEAFPAAFAGMYIFRVRKRA